MDTGLKALVLAKALGREAKRYPFCDQIKFIRDSLFSTVTIYHGIS